MVNWDKDNMRSINDQTNSRHEKTCLRGFATGKTQTGLFSYGDLLESGDFGFTKYRYYTI